MEYLDAWPPPQGHAPETRLRVEKSDILLILSESSSLSANTSSSGSPPQAKRLKHDLALSCDCGGGLTDCIFKEKSSVDLEQRLSPEELRIVRCDYSVSADALLAQWCQEDGDVKEISGRSHDWDPRTGRRGKG